MSAARRSVPALLAALAMLTSAGALAGGAVHDHTAIQTAAREYARAQLPAELTGAARVEAAALDPRLRLSACDRALESFLPPGQQLRGHASIGVRCPGPVAWTVYVPVSVHISGTVVAAARPLARGSPLARTDLVLLERDLSALPAGYAHDPQQVIGRQLRQPVAAGTLLTQSMLALPVVVRRGSTVTIVARRGSLEVRAAGEALADGAVGDPIRVRNLLTRQVIQATVRQPGIVEVSL